MLVAILFESRRADGQEDEIDVRRIGDPLSCAFRDDDDIVLSDVIRLESLDFHASAAAKNDVTLFSVDHSM